VFAALQNETTAIPPLWQLCESAAAALLMQQPRLQGCSSYYLLALRTSRRLFDWHQPLAASQSDKCKRHRGDAAATSSATAALMDPGSRMILKHSTANITQAQLWVVLLLHACKQI
jgi:hypothetical protein